MAQTSPSASVNFEMSVAFLRGINVGGHRVTSQQLVDVFADLGFQNISTFLASGNVLFGHAPGTGADADAIATALGDALGYAVPTTLRSADELHRIAAVEAFPADLVAGTAGKQQVILLFEPPTEPVQQDVLSFATADDHLTFGPRELHWLPSGGISESALELGQITELLGQNTMRTANTIRRIAAKL